MKAVIDGMENTFEIARLLDCYGIMLTQRQRSLLSQHINEDLSLFEIAEREGISRQGVRDALKRGAEQLYDFEKKLKVVERTNKTIYELRELEANERDGAQKARIERIIEICEDTYGI